nr:hypothetical protein CFP56_00863 [Quercus suber]
MGGARLGRRTLQPHRKPVSQPVPPSSAANITTLVWGYALGGRTLSPWLWKRDEKTESYLRQQIPEVGTVCSYPPAPAPQLSAFPECIHLAIRHVESIHRTLCYVRDRAFDVDRRFLCVSSVSAAVILGLSHAATWLAYDAGHQRRTSSPPWAFPDHRSPVALNCPALYCALLVTTESHVGLQLLTEPHTTGVSSRELKMDAVGPGFIVSLPSARPRTRRGGDTYEEHAIVANSGVR